MKVGVSQQRNHAAVSSPRTLYSVKTRQLNANCHISCSKIKGSHSMHRHGFQRGIKETPTDTEYSSSYQVFRLAPFHMLRLSVKTQITTKQIQDTTLAQTVRLSKYVHHLLGHKKIATNERPKSSFISRSITDPTGGGEVGELLYSHDHACDTWPLTARHTFL